MIDGLWSALGENPSATFVLAIVVLLFVLGVFVPRWVIKATMSAKDEEISRWREAWNLSEEARREERRQTEQMLDGLALITAIVRSIRKTVNGSPPPDEGDEET